MSNVARNLIIIVIIGAVGFGLYKVKMGGLMGMMMQQKAMQEAMSQAPHVGVAAVEQKNIQVWDEFFGRLVAVDQVEVRSRVAGTIEKIHFKDGALVNKDDLLFTIDQKPYLAQVGIAEGALAVAQAQHGLAKVEFGRGERLFKDKTISKRDFDERKNKFDSAVAALKSAQATFDAAKLNLDYTEIKAPFAGRVGRAEITVGNLINVGEPILTSVVSSNPIYVDFDMDEKSYSRYAADTATVDIPVELRLASGGDKFYTGKIQSFDNRVDPKTGTLRVRAIFDNQDGALVAGFFAHLKVGTPSDVSALLVSPKSIGTDQSKKFVFVVGADNMPAYREVTLGAMADGLQIIESGLKVDEKVVVTGLQRVRPGAPVVADVVSMRDADKAETPAGAK